MREGVGKTIGKIEVKKVYDHECSCCIYKDTLVKDGGWIAGTTKQKNLKLALELANEDQGRSSNITCIKGTLYLVEKYGNARRRVISLSSGDIEEREDGRKEENLDNKDLKGEYHTELNSYLEPTEGYHKAGRFCFIV